MTRVAGCVPGDPVMRHRDSQGSPNALTDLSVNRKYGAFVFLDSAGCGIESLPRAP